MQHIYVETYGAGIVYKSDLNLLEYLKENAKYLDFPGLKIYETIPSNYQYFVEYKNGKNRKIICKDTSIEIEYPIDELTEASIIYMGYILMEKQRAEKGLVTIHSACVEKEGQAILLLGRSGSGKTTLALNICQEKNYKLIGNDRNIIGLYDDKSYAFDGTKFIFLRYESIKRNLPELLPLFKEITTDSWLYKIKILPKELNILESINPSEIVSSYIIHIDDNQQDLFIRSGDTPANRLFLNEILSMYIRGIYTTFSDKNFHAVGYIPSYDKEEYYQKRVQLIEQIITNTNLQYISGNINDVAEYINNNQKIKKKIKRREENV